MAAKEEGITEVPCVYVDHLTDAQKKAYILADNRMALDAGWDEELLAVEIGAGKKCMAFGDFSYYWIADRSGRTFKRLNELFAMTGQVGFLAMERLDGKLILPEAIKTLKVKSGSGA